MCLGNLFLMVKYWSRYVIGGVSDFLDVASSKMILVVCALTEECQTCSSGLHCPISLGHLSSLKRDCRANFLTDKSACKLFLIVRI